ncbi:ABC transporter permease subunit [Roseimaritima ulvae]|uniref:ABC-2 family transporter protein n=1 Tax=Roseimaritima ulvae TaxID=980254 RepID=A0A5B9QNE2_9BACT|nr:ABC transporter permease subunit [Roseimaritima ulvae]QEG39412.1 ABC-2 family transporter protein [Roseimaritima ulvae]
MAVHDLGYRGWTGRRMARALRPWVVARSGVSLVWRRRWMRMTLLVAWLPILAPALGIFLFELSTTYPEMRPVLAELTRNFVPGNPELAAQVLSDPEAARHEVWATLILAFFRYPQAVAMVLLVGLIAPMMISYDLRSKAYLMYFSRPLTPMEYILGKSAVLWFFLSMIITIPALVLYGVGVLLSSELSVIAQTWDIPLRILAATIVLAVPTTALALCYSAFTSESRYATFTWFATWVMGSVAYRILTFAGQPFQPPRPRGGGPRWRQSAEAQEALQEWRNSIDYDKWRLLSPYDTLGKVQSWVFGLDTTPASVWPAVTVLVAITMACIWIIRNRIIARLSV